MEHPVGIEPTPSGWKPNALPLHQGRLWRFINKGGYSM